IYLNLLESKVNESEIKLVESQRAWFTALADLQAALGIDPLDSAMSVTALPPSTRPGPGHLPKGMDDDVDEAGRPLVAPGQVVAPEAAKEPVAPIAPAATVAPGADGDAGASSDAASEAAVPPPDADD
ncbi:MAG: hypothetical protein ACR2NZ_25620, partial [Rubripirellula sp.]